MSDEPRTYYDVLEVDEQASAEVIKQARRRLASEYHTDRIPEHLTRLRADAEERLKEINEAYETLKSVPHRSAYDAKLRALRGRANASQSPSPTRPTPPPPPPPPTRPQPGSNTYAPTQPPPPRHSAHRHHAMPLALLTAGLIVTLAIENERRGWFPIGRAEQTQQSADPSLPTAVRTIAVLRDDTELVVEAPVGRWSDLVETPGAAWFESDDTVAVLTSDGRTVISGHDTKLGVTSSLRFRSQSSRPVNVFIGGGTDPGGTRARRLRLSLAGAGAPPPQVAMAPSATDDHGERDRQVGRRLKAAEEAFDNREYATALRECDAALALDSRNSAARQLRERVRKTMEILGR